MKQMQIKIVAFMLMAIGTDTYALAASKPIGQLPKDVMRWSTMLVEIPKQMVNVGKEQGPLAALTWGPVKGTAHLVESTVKEAWSTVKPEQKQARRPEDERLGGPIFRYEF